MSERPDFLEWLTQPAKDDEAEEVSEWTQFMACPECKAEYPVFHSLKGWPHTMCDACGWRSEFDG